MRRGLIVLAMLVSVAMLQTVIAPSAQAYRGHHGGWGGGHHGWGGGGWGYGHNRFYGGYGGFGGYGVHRNYGFGRGLVYRAPYFGSYYRPSYGYGYRNFGYGGYGGYYPNYGYSNFGYSNFGYPNIGYSNYYNNGYNNNYYNGCQGGYQSYGQPIYQTYSQPYYGAQVIPSPTILNYYSGNTQNGGLSAELTAGTVIAQLADAVRTQRAAGNQVQLLNGNGIANGRLRGVVQNIAQGMIQNQPAAGNAINVRYTNPDSRAKARAYMTQGDNLFQEQRYAAAAQQYRAAASLAPDLAEANWRYSHTLVAMGEYDLAVNAVKRAIAASPDITRGGFTLDSLYGTLGTAKASHLESLANRALESDSPNAYFLLGMTLHYSGEAQRAEKFFARAAEIQDANSPHLVAFLGPVPKARPAPPALLARVPARET